jgi:hypothetical protein
MKSMGFRVCVRTRFGARIGRSSSLQAAEIRANINAALAAGPLKLIFMAPT